MGAVPAVDTVTFPAVEVLRPGVWNAAKGDGTVTAADIASIVAASQDPEIDAAIVHIGHFDSRFDGEPALGRLNNLRIDASGTLLADQVDTPAKLAPIMHKAWPRRSPELLRNVRTPSGRLYPMVMSGLGLLGVARPAVKGLADVAGYYAELITLAETIVDIPAEEVTVDVRTINPGPVHDPLRDPLNGGPMPLIDELRTRLALPATADETAVLAAADKVLADGRAADALLTEAAAKVKAAEVALAEKSKDDKTEVTLVILADKVEALSTALVERDRQITALTEKTTKRDRDTVLDRAITDGRLTVAERPEWDNRLAGTSGDAFAIALSERPKVWAGTGGETGTSSTAAALAESADAVSDEAIAAFWKRG